jgi:DNA-binding NarL/FixJ family response regulator
VPKAILIVDDHSFIRTAVRTFLENETEFTVCGEAVDGLEAVQMAEALQPALIILDFSMPRMSGLQAAPVLRKILPTVPIILFTLHRDMLANAHLHMVEIDAVVSKSDDLNVLAGQVRRLLLQSSAEPPNVAPTVDKHVTMA